MLKAIELTGFKSFADRTRIEFPPGITVVVGPNGSGKSNVVDAMKWVLGVRAASSIRGKAMADVIFKGSTIRKPANMAEATILLDNSDRIFGVDAQEVRVTRRIYRSGEGEYLINGETCRLRDIQDMFRGTGVGVDGYSLIEQGKVADLLTASPRDRRAIFEEAAGISRFKAKKIESQRRLERVDQNLLRLSDIVDEVDNRLRRLKSQANKAQRYKQYADRLQELRTQVGRVDWQELTVRLEGLNQELVAVTDSMGQYSSEVRALEDEGAALEVEFAQLEDDLHQSQQRSLRIREHIASKQSTIQADRDRVDEFTEESHRYRRQLSAMSKKVERLQTELDSATTEIDKAKADHQQHVDAAETCEAARREIVQRLETAQAEVESRRSERVERMQIAAELSSRIATHRSVAETSAANRSKIQAKLDEVQAARQSMDAELSALHHELSQSQEDHAKCSAQLADARKNLDTSLQAYDASRQELVELRQRHAVVVERMTLLEDIEKRMEGVGSGVKKMLELVADDSAGPLRAIHGMVADLITVKDREFADMVAVALGEKAQNLVVAGTQFIDHLASGAIQPPGRVGFVRLQSAAPPQFLREVELDDHPAVIGRADRFVVTQPEYEHLAAWLLGDTWFVETLADAVDFHRSLKVPPRFVTRAGEALARDGRLIAGPTTLELGLIPRRAELVELGKVIEELDGQIGHSEKQQVAFADEKVEWERRLSERTEQDDQARQTLEKLRLKVQSVEAKVKSLELQHGDLSMEFATVEEENASAISFLDAAQVELVDIQGMVEKLESSLLGLRDNAATLEAEEKELGVRTTAARIALAKSEQRFDAMHGRYRQLEQDADELDKSFAELHTQAAQIAKRKQDAELRILNSTASLAEFFLQEQSASAETKANRIRRDEMSKERSRRNDQLKLLRDKVATAQSERHALELDAERVQSERTILAERLMDDYGIEIAELLASDIKSASGDLQAGSEDDERTSVDEEITDLRRKLTNIGSVNMDALEELTDLESRHSDLSEQYQDLIDAKEALERIINKINADSRRLFVDSLTTIRENFQVLFRKVFGGGSADLVMEQDVDILESGIDIMATPPGKTSFALSLLSGGEQALTAVTLLLAIFQYRPSPFCVLDEVDGPLDEANIGRFIDVLHEFLEWTKFVVVTHSKKTMAAANTLHGVTMQESGVSKRVSVRFEDVSEDGNISAEAIQRAQSDPNAA